MKKPRDHKPAPFIYVTEEVPGAPRLVAHPRDAAMIDRIVAVREYALVRTVFVRAVVQLVPIT